MRAFLGLAVCAVWICVAGTSQVSIEDVKVVTADGVFEEIRKQEMENGRVIRSETIHIKKPNRAAASEAAEAPTPSQRPLDTEQQERRQRIFRSLMRHLRMAKLLHGLLTSDALEKPKVKPGHQAHSDHQVHSDHQDQVHPGHRVHRIFVIRIPLLPAALPFSAVTLPSLNRTQSLLPSPPNSAERRLPLSDKTNESTYGPESVTTPSLQDQIPPPDVSTNQITDNEIPTD